MHAMSNMAKSDQYHFGLELLNQKERTNYSHDIKIEWLKWNDGDYRSICFFGVRIVFFISPFISLDSSDHSSDSSFQFVEFLISGTPFKWHCVKSSLAYRILINIDEICISHTVKAIKVTEIPDWRSKVALVMRVGLMNNSLRFTFGFSCLFNVRNAIIDLY